MESLPENLFSWSLNVTFLLIFIFLGNSLRNASALQFLVIVVFFLFFFFGLVFLFSHGNSVESEVNI